MRSKTKKLFGKGIESEGDITISHPGTEPNYVVSENFHNLVPRSKTIVLDSDSKNGAFNKSEDGSRFSVELKNNLEIPNDAIGVNIDVHRVYIWNTFFNVTNKNNQIFVQGKNTSDVIQSKTITMGNGLYTPATFNDELLEKLKDEGFKQSPRPVLQVYPDIPKGKITIKFNYSDTIVRFDNVSNPVNDLIGFEKKTYTVTQDEQKIVGKNNAAFNTNDYILCRSNISGGEGVLLNDIYSGIIAMIPITSSPYSQIQEIINQRLDIDGSMFKGTISNRLITTQITNQNGEALDTRGENYQVVLRISWYDKNF